MRSRHSIASIALLVLHAALVQGCLDSPAPQPARADPADAEFAVEAAYYEMAAELAEKRDRKLVQLDAELEDGVPQVLVEREARAAWDEYEWKLEMLYALKRTELEALNREAAAGQPVGSQR